MGHVTEPDVPSDPVAAAAEAPLAEAAEILEDEHDRLARELAALDDAPSRSSAPGEASAPISPT